MTRKIVQIAATPDSGRYHPLLYVFCDDGSVWYIAPTKSEWTRVDEIPSTEGTDTASAANETERAR